MVTIMPITKARINLGDIVKRAKLNKEYFVFEKDGYPVAGLMGVDEFEDYLDVHNLHSAEQIKQSGAEYTSGKFRPATFLLQEMRGK